MFNSDNRKMAAYIVEYYEKFNSVDPLKIIEYVKSVDFRLAEGLIKIMEKEIPMKFSRGVFDVIGQRSLEVEIKQLLEEKEKCTDQRRKSEIVVEIGIKRIKLSEYRSKYVVEKGD